MSAVHRHINSLSPRFYAGMPFRPTAERLYQFLKTGDVV